MNSKPSIEKLSMDKLVNLMSNYPKAYAKLKEGVELVSSNSQKGARASCCTKNFKKLRKIYETIGIDMYKCRRCDKCLEKYEGPCDLHHTCIEFTTIRDTAARLYDGHNKMDSKEFDYSNPDFREFFKKFHNTQDNLYTPVCKGCNGLLKKRSEFLRFKESMTRYKGFDHEIKKRLIKYATKNDFIEYCLIRNEVRTDESINKEYDWYCRYTKNYKE